MILGFDEDRLPSVPILLFRIDDCRLDDEEPPPESLPVPTLQNAEFASLDVNFHEVNGPVLDMKIANFSEPDNLNLMRGCGESGGGETVGDSGGERRIFSKGRNLVKSRETTCLFPQSGSPERAFLLNERPREAALEKMPAAMALRRP
jgi:hypothetical protein